MDHAPKPTSRRFFVIDFDYTRGGRVGFKLDNEANIRRFLWGQQKPRYSELPEAPRFIFDKRLGRPPRDLETYLGHWLVSEGFKTVLDQLDPDAFLFTPCEVRLADGTAGPARWLCSVVRVLDALDEDKSQTTMGHDERGKFYYLRSGDRLVFRDDAVGSCHLFRMAYFDVIVICDEVLKSACKQRNLKGIYFRDPLRY